ncbi:hypothetical protein SYJ56_23695, partial [Algoriphagus sp. D3-2-R+10]|uniref:hypothetical protein n=1 Tax=Algoriphagus aurantiacus TaxID=3103948 RepID=UPI002B3A8FAA
KSPEPPLARIIFYDNICAEGGVALVSGLQVRINVSRSCRTNGFSESLFSELSCFSRSRIYNP